MRSSYARASAMLFLLFFTISLAGLGAAQAQSTFPAKPITFIVPVPAGGTTDLACRLMCKEAEKFLRQPIVVVNKPGGSFTVGIAAIAAAKPDGYTIGYAGHPGLFVPPLTEKVPYHPVNDLRQIMQFGVVNLGVIVKRDSPFKSLKDIIAYARANPKKLTYGSTGIGTLGHLAMEQVARKENVQFTHIPFKGSPETQTALLGGHVLVGIGEFNYSLIEAGDLRLIVLIAQVPSPEYPNVPTLTGLGYGIPTPTFLNIAGPKGISDEIVKQLDDSFSKGMKEPAFVKGMKELRLTVVYKSGNDLQAYVASTFEAFAKLLKEEGMIK